MRLKVGDRAPDFSLRSQRGDVVSLHDFVGKKNVVLYFYPRDFTPGCTMEANSFRDNYAAFAVAETEVIGVSSDTVERHRMFSEKCSLPFDILSDPDSNVRLEYGATSKLGLLFPGLPGRTTFVIDKEGVVRSIFASELRPTRHISEALKAVSGDRLG